MSEIIQTIKNELLTFANLCYLVAVLLAPVVVRLCFAMGDRRTQKRRMRLGLSEETLAGPAVLLARQKKRAIVESAAILLVVVLFPFVAAILPLDFFNSELSSWKIATGLMVAAFGFAASDVIKSYISGLFYFAAITFGKGIQVGDRATLLGYSGKVLRISPMFVQIDTDNDDLVTLPTSKLWSEPVVSANAGERSSLCVMEFHLAPFANSEQRSIAEGAIWEAIQASAYSDLTHSVDIFIEQQLASIIIRAKAYVASTYREFEFKSDVTRAFLDVCSNQKVPLAFDGWSLEGRRLETSRISRAA